jgi:hypothetical protein
VIWLLEISRPNQGTHSFRPKAGTSAEKNALSFEVLSDVGQKVGRAFGLVYEFTEELKRAYRGFNLDIPTRNGTAGEWALPVSATYVVDRDGSIIYAYTDVDYRDRADPRDVLQVLTNYDFSRADQLIEQAAEHTRKWIEGGGLSRPEIPNSLLPHTH